MLYQSVATARSKDKDTNSDNDSYVTLPDGNTFDISGMWEMNARLPMLDSVWIIVPLDGAAIYI